jgi:hypothetical protein
VLFVQFDSLSRILINFRNEKLVVACIQIQNGNDNIVIVKPDS